jgi:hypothetical protein
MGKTPRFVMGESGRIAFESQPPRRVGKGGNRTGAFLAGNLRQNQTLFFVAYMGLFDPLRTGQQRLEAAQVCPYCLTQLLSALGVDLRVDGRCPACKRKVFRVRRRMLSASEMLPIQIVVGIVAIGAALFVWLS